MRTFALITILSLAAGCATAQNSKSSTDSKTKKSKTGGKGPFGDGAPVEVSDTSTDRGKTYTLSIHLPHPVLPSGLGPIGSDDPEMKTVYQLQCVKPSVGTAVPVSGDWALVLNDMSAKESVVLASADGGHGVDVVHANVSCSFDPTSSILSCTPFQTRTMRVYDGNGKTQTLGCPSGKVDIQYQ